jgi:membrane associated rhomboid family serine protease
MPVGIGAVCRVYIACGVIAALAFAAMVPTSQSPLIGASAIGLSPNH